MKTTKAKKKSLRSHRQVRGSDKKASAFAMFASQAAAVGALALTVSALAVATGAKANPMPQLYILDQSFTPGCEAMDGAKVEANGNLSLFFQDLEAVTDPTSLLRARKHCQATLTVQPAPGWQIAPRSVTYNGVAEITSQGSGSVSARYFLGGTSTQAGFLAFGPGYQGDFTVTSPDASISEDSWSGCGEPVNFYAQVDAVARQAAGEPADSEVRVQNGVLQNGAAPLTCLFYYRHCVQ